VVKQIREERRTAAADRVEQYFRFHSSVQRNLRPTAQVAGCICGWTR
jgi:hypothetical protein